jgi:acid phosphatase type 7
VEVYGKQENHNQKGKAIMPDDDQNQSNFSDDQSDSTGSDQNQDQPLNAGNTQTSSSDDQNAASQTPPSSPRPRRFGNPLAAVGNLVANVLHEQHPNLAFQPLPKPTGPTPYHLSLEGVLDAEQHADQLAAMRAAERMVFHTVGDTGAIKDSLILKSVVESMVADYQSSDATARPAFFYHLGDVVYYTGQGVDYHDQFYELYDQYLLPIFAIPGNHDGDVEAGGDAVPSLSAFVTNFCAPTYEITKDAGDAHREAMTQPNVYWTLETPLATIIGLYTNVPEGGKLDDDQIAWFQSELASAPTDKALLVAMHHPVFSVDQFHAGSQYMKQVLEQAIEKTGRVLDAIFSGHVHNYQRFTYSLNGRDVPFIVAGAGGYFSLHRMQQDPNGGSLQVPHQFPELGATLENYCADRHGFMRVEVTPQMLKGMYYAVSTPRWHESSSVQLVDSFTLDLKEHRLVLAAPGA